MEEKKIKAYKAFNKDMTCRGFQYEVGKEHEMDGDIQICERGFHACENPLDLWNYYDMTTSRFAEVELSGDIQKDKDGYSTKLCSSRIKIKAELKLADIINLGVEWIKDFTSPSKVKMSKDFEDSGDYALIGSSGDGAQIGSSGDYARIGSSGYYALIGSSGDGAQIGSSGYYARIGSSGDYARIGSSGDGARIGSSGDDAQIGSSGDYALIGSSGDNARIGSSGYYALIGSSGDNARIGSSGYYARIGSSGDCARIGSSGDNARIGSSGDYAQIGSSGDGARIDSSGENSVVMCAGHNSCAKAKKGSWITLSEWRRDEAINRWIPVCVKTERIDGVRIKEDTFYQLVDGEFKEIE